MPSQTSRMLAVTNPQRFGYIPARLIFGAVCATPERSVVIHGDVVISSETGEPFRFIAREGDRLVVLPIE